MAEVVNSHLHDLIVSGSFEQLTVLDNPTTSSVTYSKFVAVARETGTVYYVRASW